MGGKVKGKGKGQGKGKGKGKGRAPISHSARHSAPNRHLESHEQESFATSSRNDAAASSLNSGDVFRADSAASFKPREVSRFLNGRWATMFEEASAGEDDAPTIYSASADHDQRGGSLLADGSFMPALQRAAETFEQAR